MRKILKWGARIAPLLPLFVALFLAPQSRADNNQIFPTGQVYQLNNLIWGTTGTAFGFNNNFYFAPLNLNESVCIFVYNNNPTSSHTFTASIVLTANPNEKTPSDGSWNSAANGVGLTAATFPNSAGGIGGLVSGAAQVSVNFSAATTQTGSPDTANVVIIQTTGNCFNGQNMLGSSLSSVSAVPPIQSISESLSQSYAATNIQFVNPGVNAAVVHVNSNNGARTLFFDKAVFSCSAACTVEIVATTTTGTTCTVLGGTPLKQPLVINSTALANSACTTNPTVGVQYYTLDVAANTPTVLDLKGLIIQPQTTNGLELSVAVALTGTMRGSIYWYEK